MYSTVTAQQKGLIMRNTQPLFASQGLTKNINASAQTSCVASNQNRRQDSNQPSLGRMFSDVCMVFIFAAMVPGCLWLGNAAGF
jgi:hypothetical protein